MNKYTQSPRAKKNSNKQNLSIVILVLIILIGIGGYFSILFLNPKVKTDPITNCSANPSKHLAILIDISDTLELRQIESLKTRFDVLSSGSKSRDGISISKGDKLSIYFVTETEKPERAFQACSPGTIEDANELIEGKYLVAQKWKNFTKEIISKINAKIELSASLKKSPILESIAYIRATEFPPSDYLLQQNNPQKLSLVVISDLLQNTKLMSFYRTSSLVSPKVLQKKYPINLKLINSNILLVSNPKNKNLQNSKLKNWWRVYFSSSVTNGELVSWSNL